MVLHQLVNRNHGVKLPVSIKYQNLHSFKKRVDSLSILETKRITRLHGSAHFTILLKLFFYIFVNSDWFSQYGFSTLQFTQHNR